MLSQRSNTHFYFVMIAGILSALAYAVLAFASVRKVGVSLSLLLTVMSVAWIAILVVFLRCRHTQDRACTTIIILFGLLFRVIGIFGAPIMEDDYYRYLWDGRTFATTGSPYRAPPSASFSDSSLPSEFQELLDNIDNPDLMTIYGPVAQGSFLLSYLMDPGKIWPLKLILFLADIALLWLLLCELRSAQIVLYAWCPLLIQEVSFTAHVDILGVVFLCCGLLLLRRTSFPFGGLLVGLATCVKPFALLFTPLFFEKSMRRELLIFLAVLLIVYGPFLLMGQSPGIASLFEMLKTFEFNSALYAIVSLLCSPLLSKIILTLFYGFFFSSFWYAYLKCRRSKHPRGDWLIGVLLLCSTVVNPWYLLWLLPFVVLFPTVWGVSALALVTLSYATADTLGLSQLGPYDHPPWVRSLEYFGIGTALLIELLVVRWRYALRHDKRSRRNAFETER